MIKKINSWILIGSLLAILATTTYEMSITHNSELFISSMTIFALASWFVLIGACVVGVGRILT